MHRPRTETPEIKRRSRCKQETDEEPKLPRKTDNPRHTEGSLTVNEKSKPGVGVGEEANTISGMTSC